MKQYRYSIYIYSTSCNIY